MFGIPWQEWLVHEGGSVLPAIVDFSKLEGVLVITSFQPTVSAESSPPVETLPAP
jgi:hypothetical protein